MKKVLCFLCIIFVSLFMANSSLADLVPLKVGYTNAMYDLEWLVDMCANDFPKECEWDQIGYVYNMVSDKITINGVEYFQEIQFFAGVESWSSNLDMPLKRSTEDTLYIYTPGGEEYAAFTIANEGKGDFIDVQELDPGDDPGYVYIECDNYNAPEQNVSFEWPETSSSAGWPVLNDGPYDDVYHFKMYNCDFASTSTCTSYLNNEYDDYWISQGTGFVKFHGGEEQTHEYTDSFSQQGNKLRYLMHRAPGNMRWAKITKNEYEDGSIVNRLNFASTYYYDVYFPGEITNEFSLEDYATGVGNTIELFHDGNSITLNDYNYESYRSGGGSVGSDDVLTFSGEFKNGFVFSAEVGELSEGTYNLVVTDGDGIVAAVSDDDGILPDGAFDHSPPVESLPVILANTFQTYNENGDLIWSWILDDFTYVAGGPYVRLYIRAYQGESYFGYYSAKYRKDGNQIIMPVDNFPNECNRLKIRAQVRLNYATYKTWSNYISVPLEDSDGDGISDHVEDSAVDSFTDGTTYGQITDRGGLVISVTDAASSDEGVLLSAYNGDGTATVSICGGSAIVELTDGDETVVTCGSAIVKVLNGDVEAEFYVETVSGPQLVAIATLTGDEPNGDENTIEFEPETGTFSVPGSNTTPVEAEFFDSEGEPVATVALVGDDESEVDNSIIFEPETGNVSAPITNTIILEVVLDDGSELSLEPGDEFMPVDINIRPFSRRNKIVLWRWGYFPVTILSNPEFYAPSEVDRSSITFGQTGDEDSLVYCFNRARYINGDGLKDLTCIFRTRDTGFEVGDTMGILKCETVDGITMQGSDSVHIIGR